jgi:hypothetical protein
MRLLLALLTLQAAPASAPARTPSFVDEPPTKLRLPADDYARLPASVREELDVLEDEQPATYTPGEVKEDWTKQQSRPDRTGQATLSRRVPLYPHLTEAPANVADEMVFNGLPMNIQALTTTDSPRDVMDFYRGVFREWHMPMIGNGDLKVHFAYPSITVFDEKDNVDISVIAIPQEHDTLVILALADMLGYFVNAQKNQWDAFGGLEPYAKVDDVSVLRSRDSDRYSMTVMFTSDDKVAAVADFYAKSMAKQGYSQGVAAQVTPEARSLEFHKGSDSWQMLVSPGEKGRTVVNAIRRNAPEEQPWDPQSDR